MITTVKPAHLRILCIWQVYCKNKNTQYPDAIPTLKGLLDPFQGIFHSTSYFAKAQQIAGSKNEPNTKDWRLREYFFLEAVRLADPSLQQISVDRTPEDPFWNRNNYLVFPCIRTSINEPEYPERVGMK